MQQNGTSTPLAPPASTPNAAGARAVHSPALGGQDGGSTPLVFTALTALRKQWPLAGLAFGLVLGLAIFVTLGITPIYEASATVIFDPNVPRPLGNQVQAIVASDTNSYLNNKEYYKTQQRIIQSMRIAREVVRKLALNRDLGFLVEAPEPGAEIESAAQLLLERLTVEIVSDSRLMTVRYRDPNPQRAHRVLATLVDTYVQQNVDDVFASTSEAADWLRGQTTTLRDALEKSEMALHEYRKRNNILSVSLDDQSNMLRGEMQELSQALTQVRARREKIAARVESLNSIQIEDPQSLPALELIDSPVLQNLRSEYVQARRLYSALLQQGKGPNHPESRAAEAEYRTMQEALLAEVHNIRSAYERELVALNQEIAGLSTLYSAAEKRALDLNLMEIEFNRLLRAKENNEKLFSLVIERSKEADLTRMLRFNNIRVLDEPVVPREPVMPNVPLNVAAGLCGGLLLGIMVALGRERLDRSIKVPEEVERDLGLSYLGLLPQIAPSGWVPTRRGRRVSGRSDRVHGQSESPELVVALQPSSGIAEAARAIRTNIVFISPDRPVRSLLVTSAGPSEGKTTVATSLAITMAQAGQRIVLVDCDLRRPRVHRLFSVSNDYGVTSALLESPEDVVVHESEVQNLSVLPSGPLPPNPAELLHSDAFRALIEHLGQRFDRVIIDSPPVLPVTDAAVLSTRVDGALLVVRASATTREVAQRAARSLRDVGGRIVGVVLNAVDLESRRYGFYRYYYYRREGYGRGGKGAEPASGTES